MINAILTLSLLANTTLIAACVFNDNEDSIKMGLSVGAIIAIIGVLGYLVIAQFIGA